VLNALLLHQYLQPLRSISYALNHIAIGPNGKLGIVYKPINHQRIPGRIHHPMNQFSSVTFEFVQNSEGEEEVA